MVTKDVAFCFCCSKESWIYTGGKNKLATRIEIKLILCSRCHVYKLSTVGNPKDSLAG